MVPPRIFRHYTPDGTLGLALMFRTPTVGEPGADARIERIEPGPRIGRSRWARRSGSIATLTGVVLLVSAGPALAAAALIAAHSGARAAMLVFMRSVPRARDDGRSGGNRSI